MDQAVILSSVIGCGIRLFFIPGLACIIHQEFWLWIRRLGNGGGNVHVYVEQTIFEITQSTGKFRRVW